MSSQVGNVFYETQMLLQVIVSLQVENVFYGSAPELHPQGPYEAFRYPIGQLGFFNTVYGQIQLLNEKADNQINKYLYDLLVFFMYSWML